MLSEGGTDDLSNVLSARGEKEGELCIGRKGGGLEEETANFFAEGGASRLSRGDEREFARGELVDDLLDQRRLTSPLASLERDE